MNNFRCFEIDDYRKKARGQLHSVGGKILTFPNKQGREFLPLPDLFLPLSGRPSRILRRGTSTRGEPGRVYCPREIPGLYQGRYRDHSFLLLGEAKSHQANGTKLHQLQRYIRPLHPATTGALDFSGGHE